LRAFEFKTKKIEFDRLPIKPTGIPVEPVELRNLNSNLNSTDTDWFPAKPDIPDHNPAEMCVMVWTRSPAAPALQPNKQPEGRLTRVNGGAMGGGPTACRFP